MTPMCDTVHQKSSTITHVITIHVYKYRFSKLTISHKRDLESNVISFFHV